MECLLSKKYWKIGKKELLNRFKFLYRVYHIEMDKTKWLWGKVISLRGRRIKNAAYLMASRNLEIWISSPSLQKSKLGWPQQPSTQKVPKFNLMFYNSWKEYLFSKHQNPALTYAAAEHQVRLFWITCKQLKLLRKASRSQVIQNSAPSVVLRRQCDIQKELNSETWMTTLISSDFPGLRVFAASMTSTASTSSVASMTSTASFHEKNY